MTHQLILADFHGLSLEIINHNGQKWLTAEQVGRALGYAQDNARHGILKLYTRNADEFTEVDTRVVKLTTPRGAQETRVFSVTGCNLLGFFSNTPRSKEFRAWAKQVLAGQAPVAASTPTSVEMRLDRLEAATVNMAENMQALVQVSRQQATKLDVTARYISLLEINQKGRVRVTRTKEAQVLALKAQGMANVDIGRLLHLSQASVSLLVHGKFPWSAAEKDAPKVDLQALLEEMVNETRSTLVEQLQGGAA